MKPLPGAPPERRNGVATPDFDHSVDSRRAGPGGSGDRVMDRRRFLLTSLAGALAGPLAAEAQPAAKMYRVGMVSLGAAQTTPGLFHFLLDALREQGYVE